jgi:tRNA threonylcarbamoyladenosine biosynthesis protein TsaE
LYGVPVTILLRGELGAGKTTLLQGFGETLGIRGPLTSPTFALEQRYASEAGELLHLDLYRLTAAQARELVASSDLHAGIRCIEWPERMGEEWKKQFPDAIDLELAEQGTGRSLTVEFRDMPLPSLRSIEQWRKEMDLPDNIVAHCHAVASMCVSLSDALLERSVIVRKEALRLAGEAHDLLRFMDFQQGGHTTDHDPARVRKWKEIASRFRPLRHEDAAAEFLREKGFAALGEIVRVHGLRLPSPFRSRIEQKVLYYADKRVAHDRVVSLDERFREFRERYGAGKESEQAILWYQEAQALEKELFPDGPPL